MFQRCVGEGYKMILKRCCRLMDDLQSRIHLKLSTKMRVSKQGDASFLFVLPSSIPSADLNEHMVLDG
ncbi:hypothetical protein AMECASPLE_019494 [Ameca splendens]|uniref:Uncharacterized protein n=1 Tax=Ameca splendens TaxID=208324 RepID=A0ABV1AAK1_9TELE